MILEFVGFFKSQSLNTNAENGIKVFLSTILLTFVKIRTLEMQVYYCTIFVGALDKIFIRKKGLKNINLTLIFPEHSELTI